MREIKLFVEDQAHRLIVEALVRRLAADSSTKVQLDWGNASGGHGKVGQQFKAFMRDIRRQQIAADACIVATDANCKGINERIKDLDLSQASMPIVPAIPDPHIERWLLLDGNAFKSVIGKGCSAPTYKCERGYYKQLLLREMSAAGIAPILPGMEYAKDIVNSMDIKRAAQADPSFKRFVNTLNSVFQSWK